MSFNFTVSKAKRQRRPLKVSLEGLSGAGKTFTALRLAFAMRRAGIGKRIVVADSENRSAELYDGVNIDGEVWEFEHCPIPEAAQTPLGYRAVYEHLVGQGFDIIIIDSMSHAWHGALERVDALGAASRSKDKFTNGWSVVTPEQRDMFHTLTDDRAHLIATMRVKTEWEITNGDNGKNKPVKIGTKTDQRENTEYEFDLVLRLETGCDAFVSKVRGCEKMNEAHAVKPGPQFWKPLFDWWLSAAEVLPPAHFAGNAALATQYASWLAGTATLGELATAWKKVNADKDKFTSEQLTELTASKDARKAELMQPQPIAQDEPGAYEPADAEVMP